MTEPVIATVKYSFSFPLFCVSFPLLYTFSPGKRKGVEWKSRIEYIIKKIADVRNEDFYKIGDMLYKNALKFFSL